MKLVILNVHEVAMAGSRLPSLEVGGYFDRTLSGLLMGCGVENHTAPQLMRADGYDGGIIELIYRVRTQSRRLSSNLHWHDTRYSCPEEQLIEAAMRLERP